jgi:esterase/lipase superfamily enzyme
MEQSGGRPGAPGNILVYIHGYDNRITDAFNTQDILQANLTACGYVGTVIAFDWPSSDQPLAYLPDRMVASQTATELYTSCIGLLSRAQRFDCPANVHLLAHSTGAYIIREAVERADRYGAKGLNNDRWSVSQIVFAAGDVSSASMACDDLRTQSLYEHCARLTNYFNRYDGVLGLANVKRLGAAPRVGRVGLPDDAHGKAIDVDCSDYYKTQVEAAMPPDFPTRPAWPHCWYMQDRLFAADLTLTLNGELDRRVIPTRETGPQGILSLSPSLVAI